MRTNLRICLISAPTATQYLDASLANHFAVREIAKDPPLGLLNLAAMLGAGGIVPRLVDLNRLYYSYLESSPNSREDFCSYASRHISSQSFDLIGLSTMCSSYPLTLRLAGKLRAAHPGAHIVLGGPQASVTDLATLEAFPFIDLVVRGEAEWIFPELVRRLGAESSLDDLPGITFRRGTHVVRNPNAPVIEDLDSLPLPAFDLLPDFELPYPFPLEIGRGCPFACRFCSTNDFFRRRFRLKSPARLVEQMDLYRRTYGVRHFELIHDMFTVDRRRVVEFCEALLACPHRFLWNCSARTDCVDDDLLRLMRAAGCETVFFGIETGSAKMQQVIDKGLDLGIAMQVLETCDSVGISTTTSLITGFPEEAEEDLSGTTAFLLDAMRFDGADPQIHLLAPLAGTPVHTDHRNNLVLDDIFSDMSHHGWPQDPADRVLIAAHSDIFPNFYAPPCRLDRGFLQELAEFLLIGKRRFRWLLVALHQESGDLLGVFRDWRAWRQIAINLKLYYATTAFPADFLSFIEERYLAGINPDSVAVAAMISYYRALYRAAAERMQAGDSGVRAAPGTDRFPAIASKVWLIDIDCDVRGIIEGLRHKRIPGRQDRRMRTFAVRGATAELLEPAALATRLMRLCDGVSTVEDIANRLLSAGVTGTLAEVQGACRARFRELEELGLIEFAAKRAAG